jgi:hypothetical protein
MHQYSSISFRGSGYFAYSPERVSSVSPGLVSAQVGACRIRPTAAVIGSRSSMAAVGGPLYEPGKERATASTLENCKPKGAGARTGAGV